MAADSPIGEFSGRTDLKLVYILLATAAFVASSFAQTWYNYNGHQYTIVSSASWTAAELLADGLGGHLVRINDQAEKDWDLNLLTTITNEDRSWIGLYQVFSSPEPDQGWVWVSEDPSPFRHWNYDTGEPNNSGGSENWGEFWIRTYVSYEHPGSWNDTIESNSSHIGLVEVVPEPATIGTIAFGLALIARRRRR